MDTERDGTGRMKLLLEAWHGDLDKGKTKLKVRKDGTQKERRAKERKPMTVNWRVSQSVCISHRGSASGSRSRLTDGAFNGLHRRGTNVGQSSEELMQNNRGLLFLTEGLPLDQIIGQAVDISLPSILSAEGTDTPSHTHIQMFSNQLAYHFAL